MVGAEPREPGVAAAGRGASPVGPHEIQVLVEPDGETGADTVDHRARHARLRLRPGPRARCVHRPGRAEGPPAAREVAIQVDAVRVLPFPVCETVRIQRRDEPEILTGVRAPQRTHDRHAGALVAVDAADDEHPRPGAGDVHELDRPARRRVADHGRDGDRRERRADPVRSRSGPHPQRGGGMHRNRRATDARREWSRGARGPTLRGHCGARFSPCWWRPASVRLRPVGPRRRRQLRLRRRHRRRSRRRCAPRSQASSFDWGLIPSTITVHIGAYGDSYSTYGKVFLDASLLDSGPLLVGRRAARVRAPGRLLPLRRREARAPAAAARRHRLVLHDPRPRALGLRLRAVRVRARVGLLAVGRQLDAPVRARATRPARCRSPQFRSLLAAAARRAERRRPHRPPMKAFAPATKTSREAEALQRSPSRAARRSDWSRSARATAWVRVSASSLSIALRTWVRTVSAEMKSRLPISSFARPSASRRSTSRSRWVSCGSLFPIDDAASVPASTGST